MDCEATSLRGEQVGRVSPLRAARLQQNGAQRTDAPYLPSASGERSFQVEPQNPGGETPALYGRRDAHRYSFGNRVHFALDRADFTAVSMNAMPYTPSSTVGKSYALPRLPLIRSRIAATASRYTFANASINASGWPNGRRVNFFATSVT